jgi:hypothetical protein
MRIQISVAVIAVVAMGFIAVEARAQAVGLAVNIPVVGRLLGGGNTLFITAIDVSNNSETAAEVDFYLDGQQIVGGASVVLNGSISASGRIVAQGMGGLMRARSNAHFDDFVEALIQANLLPSEVRANGFLGSVLFVFNGFNKSGQGAATARFYNAFGGGFVGVSLKGREITASEPQSLVAAILDTRGNTTGAPQMYPNMFINNTGLTIDGTGTAGTVDIQVSAISNSTGQPIGTPIAINGLQPGRTASVGQVLNALQIPAGSETTILVFARVTSGNAAIQGIISQVDDITRDGAVFEMSRADF